jgi:hypothetical protein
LKRVRAALAPKGRIAIVDWVPDESRVTPPLPAVFAVSMLTATKGGDAYPFSVYQEMLGGAGFQHATLHGLPPTLQQVVTAVNA